jgi:hypothetical protein
MRDKTHMVQVEQWAKFCRNNPRQVWIKYLKPFIDAQFENNARILKGLAKTREGAEKIVKLYNIKNIKGYPHLLRKLIR